MYEQDSISIKQMERLFRKADRNVHCAQAQMGVAFRICYGTGCAAPIPTTSTGHCVPPPDLNFAHRSAVGQLPFLF